METLRLYELNNQIKQTLKGRFSENVWITAEITEIQNNSSGHCYLQLADKKDGDDTIVATARATIWAFTYRMLKPYFETTTGRALSKGMKVLLSVEVVFHELYGYSLNIRDIDPTFTIGDLERKKREILEQLQKDGIIDMNRELEFPLLPKTIAVISSPTAAGLGDFTDQLQTNPYGYKFHTKLFPAIMQGDKTTESVIAALDRIYEYESLFDVVVIIRGGGSQTDLGSFDSYDLAANIAQFPLPVIAGIGHERDETIVDRVAYMKVKTPTAAAAFLIETFNDQAALLEDLKNNFLAGVKELISDEKNRQLTALSDFRRSTTTLLANNNNRLQLLSRKMDYASKAFIRQCLTGFEQLKNRLEGKFALLFDRQTNKLENQAISIQNKVNNIFANHKRRLELAATTLKYVDPKNVLERGYSVTRLNGKALKTFDLLKAGDLLETQIVQGTILSEIKEMKPEHKIKN